MTREANIKKLITLHNRRLQKLKEQEALHGLNTAPEIQLEIEDIEVKLETLHNLLEGVRSGAAPDKSPAEEETAIDDIEQELARLEKTEQPQRKVQIGGLNLSDISGGSINIGGNVSADVQQAGGDIIGGDQVINYYLQGVEAKPTLPYEPETVIIPAGSFIMGSNDGQASAAPQHTVKLEEYRIGKYPVTNRQFVEFIRQTGQVVGSDLLWDGNQPPTNKSNYPVTGVTWYEALAYCQWLSEQTGRKYTLPSEAQWEKAARGVDGRLYPWGNEWRPKRCNHNAAEFTAVDAYPEQNDYGCFDMVGNAREWTTTLWGTSRQTPAPELSYPWQDDGRNSLSTPQTIRRVYRGGRAEDSLKLRCSFRGGYLPDKTGPKRNRHGFRVVLLPTKIQNPMIERRER